MAQRLNIIIPDEPVWVRWDNDTWYKLEFDGVKFKAKKDGWNGITTKVHDYEVRRFETKIDTGNASSCSYARVMPSGSGVGATLFGWWLCNVQLNHGTIAFLIPDDGDVPLLSKYLRWRGFQLAATTKSVHAGGYTVHLFVHTGDPVLRLTRTKKVDINADLLGVTVADRDGSIPTGPANRSHLPDRAFQNKVPVAEDIPF